MPSELTLNFSEGSLTALNICLAFIMFSVALHLRWSNLRHVFKEPKSVVAGLVSQYLFLPILTGAIIYVVQPPRDVAAGMVLLAACPGGNVSNFFALIGRGNIALSVTLTTVSSLASAFTTPLLFVLLSAVVLNTDGAVAIELPFVPTLVTIGWVIVLPAAAGMVVARRFPVIADRVKRPLQNLSMLVLIGFIVSALAGNFEVFTHYISVIFVMVMVHHLLASFGGYGIAVMFGRGRADRMSIALETSVQNTALGLVITFNFFDGNGPMAFMLAWWGVWHLVGGYAFARLMRAPSSETDGVAP